MSRKPTINNNDVFGRLTVVSFSHSSKAGLKWYKCVCACGKDCTIRGTSLTNGMTKSCGCYSAELASERLKRRNIDSYLGDGIAQCKQLEISYKANAKLRNNEYTLSFDDFTRLTSSNCHYCGSLPSAIRLNTYRKDRFYIYNGIDRVDNSKGYTLENSVSCCKICNRAKNTMAYDDFILWIDKITSHRKTRM